MWTDNTTDKDFLGFDVHANLIKELIKDEKMLPLTIGLFGDWGSGKSSILEVLKKEIEKKYNEHYKHRFRIYRTAIEGVRCHK